jgi:serine/threonine protein kinase
MDKHTWQQVERLFAEAQELPQNQRETYLQEATGGDTVLCQQVLALLDDFGPACDFFEELAGDLFAGEAAKGPLEMGAKLGPYRIEEEIGRGGMSVVYRASRADGAYEEQVAIKVLRKGLDTENTLRRFPG